MDFYVSVYKEKLQSVFPNVQLEEIERKPKMTLQGKIDRQERRNVEEGRVGRTRESIPNDEGVVAHEQTLEEGYFYGFRQYGVS